ncbi:MAG TPA: hypothetical protein VG738_08215 [Chitinophagaceae bacterium]|nr:hypothetical protein [Chitinophagaceae bacterium]
MHTSNQAPLKERRTFLKQFATGAAILGTGILSVPLTLSAAGYFSSPDVAEAEEWFKQVKGKHRMVFDVTQPHEILPFAWPKVFLLTNEKTGTPAKDCSAVVVLRHEAIPYALEDRLWEKYKLGEVFKITDAKTKAPSLRNPFWKPQPGDYVAPGLGAMHIGINELQDDGVMFCACDVAMTVYSAVLAAGLNQDAAEVKKDIVAGILPGVQPVPSGVWAVGRAQEHGCGYCFAG